MKIRLKVGNKYGMITLLEAIGRTSHYEMLFKCRCECGKEFIRKDTCIRNTLERGYIPSCGCGRKKKNNYKNPQLILDKIPNE